MAKAAQNNVEEITHNLAEAATEAATQATDETEQKVISHPRDVSTLVMSQMNQINNKKDDLTIAIKALTDTTDQLVKAYAGNMNTMQQMQARIKELEEKAK